MPPARRAPAAPLTYMDCALQRRQSRGGGLDPPPVSLAIVPSAASETADTSGHQQALDLILPLVRRFCSVGDGLFAWKPPVATSMQDRPYLFES